MVQNAVRAPTISSPLLFGSHECMSSKETRVKMGNEPFPQLNVAQVRVLIILHMLLSSL